MNISRCVRAYFFGPRLYTTEHFTAAYSSNPMEAVGGALINICEALKTFCIASSPLLAPYILARYDAWTILRMTGCMLVIYAMALCLRAVGRFTNGEYRRFVQLQCKLAEVGGTGLNAGLKECLKRYDYEIAALPVADFVARARPAKWFAPTHEQDGRDPLPEPLSTLRDAFAYWAAHSFGCRMLFPGSLAVLKALIGGTLAESRRKIFISKEGSRNVLKSEDGTIIDSMFWDRRGKSANGDTLVVCFEGNAGFYEVGITGTPNSLEYSVLGWNMPGFGESGGAPSPLSIVHAADAVMQLATERLGFLAEDIVLYAWSIGGYPASWTAANYCEIRALILDASFDDLVPLAVSRMPGFLRSLVCYSVRKYLDLPIAIQLRNYPGPVRFIRRWHDEIIINDEAHLDAHGRRATNRANFLLIDFLRHRYPGLLRTKREVELVKTWLALDAQSRVIMFNSEEPSAAHAKLLSALADVENKSETNGLESLNGAQLSVLIQQLCNKHFVDFEASHNMPLNAIFFNIPTQLMAKSAGGVFSGSGHVLGRGPTDEATAKSGDSDKQPAAQQPPGRRNSRDSIRTLSSMGSSTDSGELINKNISSSGSSAHDGDQKKTNKGN